MIPTGELKLDQVYLDDDKRFALLRRFVKETAGTDVIISHELARIPKQVFIVASEGKNMQCWIKINANGIAVKDLRRVTLQFSDKNAIVTLRME